MDTFTTNCADCGIEFQAIVCRCICKKKCSNCQNKEREYKYKQERKEYEIKSDLIDKQLKEKQCLNGELGYTIGVYNKINEVNFIPNEYFAKRNIHYNDKLEKYPICMACYSNCEKYNNLLEIEEIKKKNYIKSKKIICKCPICV